MKNNINVVEIGKQVQSIHGLKSDRLHGETYFKMEFLKTADNPKESYIILKRRVKAGETFYLPADLMAEWKIGTEKLKAVSLLINEVEI